MQDSLRSRLERDLQRLGIGVNRTQFRAQLYEEQMVDLVRDMALSNEASMDHRLKCAAQVVQWARGGIETWRHDRETMQPDSPVITGGTVGEAVEAARSATELFSELDGLVRRKIPFRDWPERIRNLAEAAAFAELEEDDVVVGIAAPLTKS